MVFANDGFYQLYGYTKEQFEREPSDVLSLILPEDREKTKKTVARIVKNRSSETYEYRCLRKDGSIMWTQTTNTVISLEMPYQDGSVHIINTSRYPIMNTEGNVIGVFGTGRDVTKIKEQEIQLQLLNDAIPGGMAAFSIQKGDIKTLYFHEGFYQFSGYTEAEYLEKTKDDPLALMFEEDRPKIRELLQKFDQNREDGHHRHEKSRRKLKAAEEK